MTESMNPFRLSSLTSENFGIATKMHPVILISLGSQEDHGPQLPMGDYVLAEYLALRIAEQATLRGAPTFVAPSLPFGVADYFGSAPGSMALSAGTFRGVLFDLFGGLLRQSLDKIIILNGHGGNTPVIHEVTLDIRRDQNVVIPSIYLWRIARQLMEKRLGPGHELRFGHGAEPLLSLSAALRPSETRLGAKVSAVEANFLGLPVVGFGQVEFDAASIDVPIEFDRVPRLASECAVPLVSAALGQEVADTLVDVAARFVHYFYKVSSESGVSKSRNTESSSTGTSAVNAS
jgi:creatinine amidohydrolase